MKKLIKNSGFLFLILTCFGSTSVFAHGADKKTGQSDDASCEAVSDGSKGSSVVGGSSARAPESKGSKADSAKSDSKK